MNLKPEEEKIFSDIMEEMKLVYLHDKRPWMVGFSGGKDSTVLVSLIFEMLNSLDPKQRHKMVHIVSSDTMVENPIVRDYMHDVSNMINIFGKSLRVDAKIIYPRVEDTFWCRVIGLGYPTPEPPGFRWCTERLKIHPMNRFTVNTIKKNGEIVLLLGVRKAESSYRARNIKNREIDGKLLVPHSDIENAYVYNPLTEIPNDVVWKYLLKDDGKSPWGTSNKYLFSLYQGENLGEEASVIGEVDKDKIPVTGNSRFGCWVCTMVKEDKSLKNFIEKGETWLEPLRDCRNELLELRSDPGAREDKRRNGAVYLVKGGTEKGKGPFTLDARYRILEKLLDLQVKIQEQKGREALELITVEELKMIDRMWEAEGDLSRRKLVDLYHRKMGKRLPWDEFRVPLFDEETIACIKEYCQVYNVEFELISKLLISIEKNKNYTRGNSVQREFDKILNQGWLHFERIQEGLKI